MRKQTLPAVLLACGAAATALTGCSQINSLKQVSGVPLNTLQIAIGDELINQGVSILVTPVCTENTTNNTFECKGTTTTNQPIIVTTSPSSASTFTLSPGGTPTAVPDGTLTQSMEITVGGKKIYSGSVQAVIDKSERRAQ